MILLVKFYIIQNYGNLVLQKIFEIYFRILKKRLGDKYLALISIACGNAKMKGKQNPILLVGLGEGEKQRDLRQKLLLLGREETSNKANLKI